MGNSFGSMQAHSKIALIGCRNVAPTSAYSLLNGTANVEMVLIGDHAESLLRSVAELIDRSPLRSKSLVRIGEPEELNSSDVCIVSSGVPPIENDTKDVFLSRNIEVIKEKGKVLRESGFKGVLIVTSQPAEIMAQVAMEASGLPSESVIGIGQGSVTNLAKTDRSLPLATWCSAAGCDVEYIDSCHPDCPYFEDMLERFHSFQRSGKHHAAATMASCVMRVCEAVINDERAVLPVATLLTGQHSIMGTFSNVPCVIAKHGVERVLELPLTDVEQKDLLDAARQTGRLFYRLTKPALAASSGKSA